MKKVSHIIATLGLAALLSGTGLAESRFINTTGKVLKIDVLSQAGQTKDVELSATPAFTEHIGAKVGGRTQEMIVVKDASGKELMRQKMQPNALIGISMWGDDPTLTFLGYSQGDYNNEDDRPTIINASGGDVNYKLEYADFEVTESKISGGALGSNNDSARADSIGSDRETGETIKTTFSSPQTGTMNVDLIAGNTYLLTSVGGKGVLTLIRTHDK